MLNRRIVTQASILRIAALLAASALYCCCDGSTPAGPEQHSTAVVAQAAGCAVVADGDTVLTLRSLKWPHGATAAVSITYDAPWGSEENHHLATDAIFARDLTMDIEVVSAKFLNSRMTPFLVTYRNELMPRGVHFFGHGHTHALHDTMEYDAAYESFYTNFQWMRRWGLNPKAYCYPGSSGRRTSTQLANQAAGFICARGCTVEPDEYYIVPDDVSEPKSWYYLPSVVMGSESYRYIDTHDKLVPILDGAVTRTAWLILMYHAIDIPTGWGYYPLDEFERDLDSIVERDFWCANMDDAACYVKERSRLDIDLTQAVVSDTSAAYGLTLSDGLPDDVYDQPLTFVLEVAPASGWCFSRLTDEDGAEVRVVATGSSIEFGLIPDERVWMVELKRD